MDNEYSTSSYYLISLLPVPRLVRSNLIYSRDSLLLECFVGTTHSCPLPVCAFMLTCATKLAECSLLTGYIGEGVSKRRSGAFSISGVFSEIVIVVVPSRGKRKQAANPSRTGKMRG